MHTSQPMLGQLEPVNLREVWESEAGHFTPWLAQEESIALLGKTILIELEVEAQERPVGPFRADILCKDTLTGDWVLIENQLERTDHTHLGQLLTYAAGLKAVTVVWISARFTDEHRAALDWLNEMTSDEIRFFGLEVEAWRIGSSPPAPKFNIVSKPNDWSRQVSGGARRIAEEGELSKAQQLQLEFWNAFRDYAEKHAKNFRPTKPLPQSWMSFSVGRTGFTLVAIASTWSNETNSYDNHEIRAELQITTPNSDLCLDALEADRSGIEGVFGEPLQWHKPENTKTSKVSARRSADLEERGHWPEYHHWLTTRLDNLHSAFHKRVRALDLTALAPSE